MIDLNPHVPPATQKRIGSLTMSDKAGAEMALILGGHGHPELATPDKFGVFVAPTIADFLSSAYFRDSAWFRRQEVHRTSTLSINDRVPPVTPIFHLQKTPHGHAVVSCDEAPLADDYYEQRVIEETKVEMGIPA